MSAKILTEEFRQITEEEFWEAMVFAPIKRMGFSNGPGAVFHGECQRYRACKVDGQMTRARLAHFVLAKPDGKGVFYEYVGDETEQFGYDVTLEEFKEMCSRIIPGVGPCDLGYGKDL